MIYLLVLLLGIKANMSVWFWIIYTLWVIASPFVYFTKHNIFFEYKTSKRK